MNTEQSVAERQKILEYALENRWEPDQGIDLEDYLDDTQFMSLLVEPSFLERVLGAWKNHIIDIIASTDAQTKTEALFNWVMRIENFKSRITLLEIKQKINHLKDRGLTKLSGQDVFNKIISSGQDWIVHPLTLNPEIERLFILNHTEDLFLESIVKRVLLKPTGFRENYFETLRMAILEIRDIEYF